ncbi:MAG: nitrilase-related carbon-nitrogen hydrolase [Fimbriimonas sp.]
MATLTVRVASVAWKLRGLRGDSAYFGHLHDLVSAAHDEGAQIVVLPELHVLELLPLARDLSAEQAPRFLVQYAQALEEWLLRIARNSGMTIVGGSHFRNSETGIRNVCAVAKASGELVLSEKNNLTTYERDVWGLEPGKGLSMFAPYAGVTVCYDSEFPAAARALADKGTLLHCVPAWTETQRGFQRVRWSCLARAVENQNFVVHASLLGDLGREPVPSTWGSSAIIAPSVEPFPVEAILRETELNEEGVVVADLNFDQLAEARLAGEVTNWQDRDSGVWDVHVQHHPDGEPPTNVYGGLN